MCHVLIFILGLDSKIFCQAVPAKYVEFIDWFLNMAIIKQNYPDTQSLYFRQLNFVLAEDYWLLDNAGSNTPQGLNYSCGSICYWQDCVCSPADAVSNSSEYSEIFKTWSWFWRPNSLKGKWVKTNVGILFLKI